ncbi:MAG TPA: flippase [Candidatus Dormibacteraeota bacterium]|nr:flippase [Candidatus Dormibacteraeota bacterium]
MPDNDLADSPPATSLGLGSRALRNTIVVLAAKVVARLIALVTVLYMIRKLGQDHYGTFTVLVNLTAIVSVVLDLGFNVLFVREGARHHDEIQRYLRNVMSLRVLMAVLSLPLLAAVIYPIGLGYLLLPGFVLMVLTSYSTLLRNGLYAVQQLGFEALAVILESAVLLVLIVYGGRTNQGVVYYVWAYAAQYAFSCVYFTVVLAVKRIAVIGWRFEWPLLREWFWKGLPFALTFVLTILYFRIDQPLIYVFKGVHQASWYAAAYKPIESLLFVPITFLSIVFPVLSVYFHERRAEMLDAVSRFYKALLLMGWPVSVGIFVLARPLTPLLLGNGFLPSEPALRILALALGIAFINNTFIGALNASDRQSSFSWAAGWSVVANLALNLTLIPLFGYIGASWATVLTELALGLIGWFLTARHVGRVPVVQLSWRIVAAGLVMGAAIYPLSSLTGVELALPIGAGAVIYAVLVLLLRAVDGKEIAWARRALALAP